MGLIGLMGSSCSRPLEFAGILVWVAIVIQRKMVSQECSVESYWNNPADPADRPIGGLEFERPTLGQTGPLLHALLSGKKWNHKFSGAP
jgi:hypothetical protein